MYKKRHVWSIAHDGIMFAIWTQPTECRDECVKLFYLIVTFLADLLLFDNQHL